MENVLIGRIEPYFRHPDHDVLKVGDRSVACKNVRQVLTWLGLSRHSGDDPLLFDPPLFQSVKNFQENSGHRNVDGRVGPGTRTLLATRLFESSGLSKLSELDGSEVKVLPTVFISYAWLDTHPVEKLEQWLRDHNVEVIRDSESFVGGQDIKEAIRTAVLKADKVLAIWSLNSSQREWPIFEQYISEEVERQTRTRQLIYVRLDDTPLKATDPHRLAIDARTRTLKQVGDDILKTLGFSVERTRVDYDPDEPIGVGAV